MESIETMRKKSNLPINFPKNTALIPLQRQHWIGMMAFITLITASVVSVERTYKKWEAVRKLFEEHFSPVCEQYALTALKSDNYPCFECKNNQLFLKQGEVWRYGFAGKGGEKTRYPTGTFYVDEKWRLTKLHLKYMTEYKGVKWRCLLEEIFKIYDYPELPEAQKREIKLIRPPGNKQDR